MPIIRRVVTVGTSRAVTIPPTWLREIEERTGRKVDELLMEIDTAIRIYPREAEQ